MTDDSELEAPVTAYIAASLEQAHIVRNALEERGIAAEVSNSALQFAVGKLPFGTPTAARVMVARRDLAAAREIVERFDNGLVDIEDDDRDEWDDESEAPQADARWPRCPSCGRGRHTSCPTCGTAGSKFPRAYVPPGEPESTAESPESSGLAVVCGICDEPFTAQFPSRCEWCGYRFADGRDIAPPPAFVDEMNPRVWIVLVGLLAVVGAVLAWGFYIAPRS